MAYLVFQFPTNIDAQTAIRAVADHFGASVDLYANSGVIVNYNVSVVPPDIKQAVERVGAQLIEDPSTGVETNPAIAFGGLLNGAGNAAPSSADAATSTIAHAVSPVISQTTPPAPSVPVPPIAHAAVAPTASAAPATPASVEFDSTGLAWDERIHSGNKTKTPGGEWRTKKGTDKSLIKSVELELRAKHPNAACVTNGAAANAPVGAVVSAAPIIDPAAARAYAHAEALRVAGPQMIDDTTLAALFAGQQFTMSIDQNEWYSVFYAKYQAAHAAFITGNVVTAPPVAPASPTPTINEAPAQVVAPSIPAVSPTAAVGTVAPASTASHGELDATGLPHDTRIHIGAKLKDTAGVWIQRHDVPGEQKLLIMVELRAALNTPNVAEQVANTPTGPVSTPVAPTLAPVVPVVSAADAGTDFAKMMQWIVANQMAGRITPTAGPEAAKTLGFVDADGNGQLALMTQQIAYLPYIVQILQGQGAV